VYKHKLGNDASKDELVYFEKDDTFNVSVSKEKSKKYIVIESSSTLTTESRISQLIVQIVNLKFFKKEYAVSNTAFLTMEIVLYC
jgi:oligopeptidase B